jgi:branched-chain amino acid aminotransferase
MTQTIHISKTENSRINTVDFHNIPFGRIFSDHMFEADYIDGKWTNLQIRPMENLSIHPSMMALHYGQSIFEGMKASKHNDGTPLLFRPELHAKRFNESAKRMMMPTIPEEIFLEGLHKLISLDRGWIPPIKGSAMYIRPVMFATDAYIGVAASNNYKFLILTLPVGPYYERPISLKVERKYVRAVEGGVGEAKTCGNYAAALLPTYLAKDKGFDQVIWMDAHEFKYIQEVGTMNLFFVFKDKVITPATTGTILKGITRRSIKQILKSEGIEVEERQLSIDEVFEAYKAGSLVEAFGSGTAALVGNINRIVDGDKEMTFDESNWTLSTHVKRVINEIRSGEREDAFGWIVPVKDAVMAE